MPLLHDEWPPSTNPYRHYVCARGGVNKETGEKPAAESVAIVIPVRNGLKFFKLCFHSILNFTDHPYTLTVIDHLGDLSTKKYLRTMHANHQVYVQRYEEEAFNYSAEVNLGLREAFKFPQVKYGLVLNADTIVEPFWLSKMLTVMNCAPDVGIVGPVSNKALSEQTNIDLNEAPLPSQRVSGFCMLFRREVWEQMEGFDEQFVGGGFEDWDFCERARRAGWHVLIDRWTHIHHFYKQFRQNNLDKEMRANEERFFKKHPLVYDLVKCGDLIKTGD